MNSAIKTPILIQNFELMEIYNILINDEIGRNGVTAKYIRAEIAKAKEKGVSEIRVVINSPGGEVYEGYDIFNALNAVKQDNIKVTTFVTGQCASIATLIACAGDEIISSPVSQWMFHEPSGGAHGNAQDLIDNAKALEQIREAMAETYATRMNKTVAEGLALMSKGDYYIRPQELAKMGFIQSVAVPPSAVSKNKIEMIKDEKQAKNILDRIFKAIGVSETPTAGVVRLADGETEIHFVGEEITEGTVLYTNADMTELAPEGDHVLADGKIVTLDASGAVVRIAEIESKKYTEEEMQASIDAAVATALAEKEAEITALKGQHETAMASVRSDVTALQALIVSDKKPAPRAGAVQPAPRAGAAKEELTMLDRQALDLKRQLGIK